MNEQNQTIRNAVIGYTVMRLVEVVPVLGGIVKLVLLNVAFGCVTIALWRWRLSRRMGQCK